MLGWGEKFGVGFGKFVSSGNEGDLRSEDYLAFLGRDPETKVILFYIEGLDDGREFLATARKITPHKPIVALKGGKTFAGARAARSHSGAMAGVRELYEAAFRQAGILWASTTEEMLEWAGALSSLPLPRGNRVGILTRGGGWGVITADACNDSGLEVPPLEEKFIRALDSFLPSYWSRGNPVDMVATLGTEAYIKCLDALVSWDKVDAVISMSGDAGPLALMAPAMKERAKAIFSHEKIDALLEKISGARARIYRRIGELIGKYHKPIFAVGSALAHEPSSGQPDFILAQFATPERAAKAAGALYRYYRYRKAIGME
jgi:acyl-CoA synthetase (NDP forming)